MTTDSPSDDDGRADRACRAAEDDDAPVPKLPRGKGVAISGPALMRLGLTAITLVAILVLQKPCSRAVGTFVTSFGEPPAPTAAGSARPPSAEAPGAEAPSAASGSQTPSSAPTAGAPAPPSAEGPRKLSDYEVLTPSMTDEELRQAIERAKRRAAAAEAAAPAPVPAPAPAAPASPVPAPAAPASPVPAPAAPASAPGR